MIKGEIRQKKIRVQKIPLSLNFMVKKARPNQPNA